MKISYKIILFSLLASCQGQVPSGNSNFNNQNQDGSDVDDGSEVDGDIAREYKLVVRVSGVTPDASGTIQSDPAGIDCGTSCSLSFDSSRTMTLTAIPSPGSEFVSWSDNANSSPTRSVIVDGIKSITAIFASGPQYIIEFAGTGRGTITTASNKFNCNNINIYKSGTCYAPLDSVTNETFTASPAPGSKVGAWSESSCGSNAVCTGQVTSQKSITATFVDLVTIPGNVSQLITSACGGCHNSAWNSMSPLRLRKTSLTQRITSGNMPPNRSLSADEKNLILDFLDTL